MQLVYPLKREATQEATLKQTNKGKLNCLSDVCTEVMVKRGGEGRATWSQASLKQATKTVFTGLCSSKHSPPYGHKSVCCNMQADRDKQTMADSLRIVYLNSEQEASSDPMKSLQGTYHRCTTEQKRIAANPKHICQVAKSKPNLFIQLAVIGTNFGMGAANPSCTQNSAVPWLSTKIQIGRAHV